MKKLFNGFVLTSVMLGTAGGLLVFFNAHANTAQPPLRPLAPAPAARPSIVSAAAPAPRPVIAPSTARMVIKVSDLDHRRQYALGMIETGNDDSEIGGAGEVSRFQIMPSVWQQYSDSRSYQNPAVARTVAQQHWFTLYARFKQQARREPTDFDMYVLWNTRSAYYANRGFDPARLGATVRDRAQRFVNLVESATAQCRAPARPQASS